MGIPFHNNKIEQCDIDLNQFLVKRKSSTFIWKMANGLLIIDRSKNPVSGSMIIAVLNSEFMVKELLIKEDRTWLLSRDKKNSPIEIFPETDFFIWGVVTFIIHYAEKNTSAS
jgi:DNA polymerase V